MPRRARVDTPDREAITDRAVIPDKPAPIAAIPDSRAHRKTAIPAKAARRAAPSRSPPSLRSSPTSLPPSLMPALPTTTCRSEKAAFPSFRGLFLLSMV